QRGIIAALDFEPSSGVCGRDVAARALQHGVWLRPQPHMLYAMPPLSITLEEIDHLMGVIAGSIDEALG
ncbi:MAG: adenosylmethionine--8-amino-7-oxononanoate aminotransferase BioA, partial [Planctomycetota bacterium]